MTTSYAVNSLTLDLLSTSDVSLPHTFLMTPGCTINITFPDGRTGTMTITGEPLPGIHRGSWMCAGSGYDGRDFNLSWGTKSELGVPGQPIMVPVIINLAP
jgi:hypothetical protein